MERIILDVDTGHDDAVAITMAAGLKDKIKVEALIATGGNQVLAKTLENTLNMAEAVGLDCPVYFGSDYPLIRERVVAGHIHGENGLEGPVFAPRKKQQCAGNGLINAIRIVSENPGEITFVSTGPLTDLALCLKIDPSFGKNLKQIVFMGGSLVKGNVTPSAEFNFFADAESAKIVLNSGVKTYMFGLDVTQQVMYSELVKSMVQALPKSKAQEVFLASMECYTRACKEVVHDYPAMHDPCCIAFLAEPSIFEFQTALVDIETSGKLTYGRTVEVRDSKATHFKYGIKADNGRFWDLFALALTNLSKFGGLS